MLYKPLAHTWQKHFVQTVLNQNSVHNFISFYWKCWDAENETYLFAAITLPHQAGGLTRFGLVYGGHGDERKTESEAQNEKQLSAPPAKKENTSHYPHLIHHIWKHPSYMLLITWRPIQQLSKYPYHQLLTTILTSHTGKAHWLFRLTLQIIIIHIMQSKHQEVL